MAPEGTEVSVARRVMDVICSAVIFVIAGGGAILIQITAWRNDVMVALGLPILLYSLVSFRMLSWKTRFRKAFSLGLCAGMTLVLAVWGFKIPV
jgi:hypothetical protein